MKKIATQGFVAKPWLVHWIRQLIKAAQNVILKWMVWVFWDVLERLVEGPSCQFSYTPRVLGFSEKNLIF